MLFRSLQNEFISGFINQDKTLYFIFALCVLFIRSFTSLDRQRGLLMYINVAVISVMAHNLNVVVHILIVQQVSVVICSARENKS